MKTFTERCLSNEIVLTVAKCEKNVCALHMLYNSWLWQIKFTVIADRINYSVLCKPIMNKCTIVISHIKRSLTDKAFVNNTVSHTFC